MTPGRHVVVSGLLALGCGMAYHSPAAAMAAVVGGLAIDVDHLLDFKWNCLGTFKPIRFLRMCREFRLEKLYLLLHSLEWILPFLAWSYLAEGPSWFKAAGLGLGAHLYMDILGNGMRVEAYFLTFRLAHRFDSRAFVYTLPPQALAYWGSYAAYLKKKPARHNTKKWLV